MRSVLRVAGRELRAQAPAAAVALAAAALPWVTPWLPVFDHHPPGDVRQATSLVVAALLAVGLSLLAGAGMVGRELGEGRLAFYLALPLRTGELWAGKLLGACLLVYGACVLALLPVLAGGGGLTVLGEPLEGTFADLVPFLVTMGPLLLLLGAHQLAVALRARSAWLALEVAAWAIATLVALSALLSLVRALAEVELRTAASALPVAVAAVLVAAGWVGLAHGRALASRVHRGQAVTTAGGLLAVALTLAGASRWVLEPTRDDVVGIERVSPAPAGDWVAGVARLAHRPSFTPWVLLDQRGGFRVLAADTSDSSPASQLVFAADGRLVAWKQLTGGLVESFEEVGFLALDGGEVRPLPGVLKVERGAQLALSADGSLLGVREGRRLSLWTMDGMRLLAAAELPREGVASECLWIVEGELRLARAVQTEEGWDLQLRRLRGSERRLVVAPPRPLASGAEWVPLLVSPAGDRILVVRGYRGTGALSLHDAKSGEELALLAPAASLRYRNARFLADGRVAVLVPHAGGAAVALFSADGMPLAEWALGPGSGGTIGQQWSAETLAVTVQVGERGEGRGELRALDLGDGTLRTYGRLMSLGWSTALAPGSPGSRLVWDPAGDRWEVLDPDSGTRRPLLSHTAGERPPQDRD